MDITELLEDQKFLGLLDENDSYAMTNFIYEQVRMKLPWDNSIQILFDIRKLFEDLNIFQDIALPGCDQTKNYKYIAPLAFYKTNVDKISLRNAHVFTKGINEPISKCSILIDKTTKLNPKSIILNEGSLLFLGIPFCGLYGIIVREPTEIYATPECAPAIEQMIEKEFILGFKSKIKIM